MLATASRRAVFNARAARCVSQRTCHGAACQLAMTWAEAAKGYRNCCTRPWIPVPLACKRVAGQLKPAPTE